MSEVGWDGTVYWTTRATGIHHPSEAPMLSRGNILLVDYSKRGQVLVMTPQGKETMAMVWQSRITDRQGHGLL